MYYRAEQKGTLHVCTYMGIQVCVTSHLIMQTLFSLFGYTYAPYTAGYCHVADFTVQIWLHQQHMICAGLLEVLLLVVVSWLSHWVLPSPPVQLLQVGTKKCQQRRFSLGIDSIPTTAEQVGSHCMYVCVSTSVQGNLACVRSASVWIGVGAICTRWKLHPYQCLGQCFPSCIFLDICMYVRVNCEFLLQVQIGELYLAVIPSNNACW